VLLTQDSAPAKNFWNGEKPMSEELNAALPEATEAVIPPVVACGDGAVDEPTAEGTHWRPLFDIVRTPEFWALDTFSRELLGEYCRLSSKRDAVKAAFRMEGTELTDEIADIAAQLFDREPLKSAVIAAQVKG
jgi:hypothetical protein